MTTLVTRDHQRQQSVFVLGSCSRKKPIATPVLKSHASTRDWMTGPRRNIRTACGATPHTLDVDESRNGNDLMSLDILPMDWRMGNCH